MLKKVLQSDPDVLNFMLTKLAGQDGDQKEIILGRGPEVDFALDSKRCPLLISRRHASIKRQGTHLYITDSKSTNGTYINDRKLEKDERKELKDGDIVTFGGASKVRQMSNANEEPNPFSYKVKHTKRLFHPSTDATNLAALSGSEASSVVDLTRPCTDFQIGNVSSQQGFIDLTDEGPSAAAPPRRSRFHETAATILRNVPNQPTTAQANPHKRGVVVNLESDSEGGFVVPPLRKPAVRQGSAPNSASKRNENPTLKALEAEFECQICREFMIGAHSLVPCGHMFCGECACEWLDKKRTCPACRVETTSAPVPSIKVDNIIEEVAVPHMNKDSKAERDRRKLMWARTKASHAAKMEKIHKRVALTTGPDRSTELAEAQLYASELQAAVLAGHRAFPGPEQRGAPMGHSHLPMNPPGGTTYWAATGFHTGRGTGPNGRARSNPRRATGPQHTPGVFQPLRSLPEGAPMFCVVAHSGRLRTCSGCRRPIQAQMPMILRSSGPEDQSAYHVGCEARIEGFLTAWVSMNGAIPGSQHLGAQNQARIRALAAAAR